MNVIERAGQMIDELSDGDDDYAEERRLIEDLVAKCKRQQEKAAAYCVELAAAGEIAVKREQTLEDRITQLQHDVHRLHEHELLLGEECKRLNEWMIKNRDIATDLQYQLTDMEAEAARWQAVATEERCKVIMLIEKLKDVANNPDWQTRGLSKTHDEYIKQAAEELQAAAALGKPRAWPMNEKREIALETFADFIEKHLEPLPEDDVLLICKREFRDMLAEAKQ